MAVSVYFATNRNPINDAVPNNFETDFNPWGDVMFGPAVLKSVADESELGNSNFLKTVGVAEKASLRTGTEHYEATKDSDPLRTLSVRDAQRMRLR